MRINAHEPRPARFVIGVRASARHIVPGYNIARGLGIAFTPQTFVEDVIHAASQADIFRHIPVALRPTMLYGLTSLAELPVTGLPR